MTCTAIVRGLLAVLLLVGVTIAAPGVKGGYRQRYSQTQANNNDDSWAADTSYQQNSATVQSSQTAYEPTDDLTQSTSQQTSGGYTNLDDSDFHSQGQIDKLTGFGGSDDSSILSQGTIDKLIQADAEAESSGGGRHASDAQNEVETGYALQGEVNTLDTSHTTRDEHDHHSQDHNQHSHDHGQHTHDHGQHTHGHGQHTHGHGQHTHDHSHDHGHQTQDQGRQDQGEYSSTGSESQHQNNVNVHDHSSSTGYNSQDQVGHIDTLDLTSINTQGQLDGTTYDQTGALDSGLIDIANGYQGERDDSQYTSGHTGIEGIGSADIEQSGGHTDVSTGGRDDSYSVGNTATQEQTGYGSVGVISTGHEGGHYGDDISSVNLESSTGGHGSSNIGGISTHGGARDDSYDGSSSSSDVYNSGVQETQGTIANDRNDHTGIASSHGGYDVGGIVSGNEGHQSASNTQDLSDSYSGSGSLDLSGTQFTSAGHDAGHDAGYESSTGSHGSSIEGSTSFGGSRDDTYGSSSGGAYDSGIEQSQGQQETITSDRHDNTDLSASHGGYGSGGIISSHGGQESASNTQANTNSYDISGSRDTTGSHVTTGGHGSLSNQDISTSQVGLSSDGVSGTQQGSGYEVSESQASTGVQGVASSGGRTDGYDNTDLSTAYGGYGSGGIVSGHGGQESASNTQANTNSYDLSGSRDTTGSHGTSGGYGSSNNQGISTSQVGSTSHGVSGTEHGSGYETSGSQVPTGAHGVAGSGGRTDSNVNTGSSIFGTSGTQGTNTLPNQFGLYFPGERIPSGFSGHVHSSSSQQNSASQHSTSSSSHSSHSFGTGGLQQGSLQTQTGNTGQFHPLGSGGLSGIFSNLGSLGNLGAVHHSSSSSSSASSSQNSNSASHNRVTYSFGNGNLEGGNSYGEEQDSYDQGEIGLLQQPGDGYGLDDEQQSEVGLLQTSGGSGLIQQESQLGHLQEAVGNVDDYSQQSQSGQLQEAVGNVDDYSQQSQSGQLQSSTSGSGSEYDDDKYDQGIAPNLAGGDGGREYGGIGSSSWLNGWNKFTDWGANAASDFAGGAREFGYDVADTATGFWNKVEDKFPSVWERFKNVLRGFSDSIHKGATYCAHVLQQKADDVQSSAFLQKLEDQFEQGNEEVMEFFQVLGDKMSKWADQHANDGIIDDGFTGENYQQNAGRFTELQDSFQHEDFPDFFQDTQVQGQIEKLVDHGIIQQNEADLFIQQRQ